MNKEKRINCLAIIGITIAVIFSLVLVYFPSIYSLEAAPVISTYESELFDKTKIMTVDIQMDDEKWQDMIENAASEEYYTCDIVVNGVTYKNVGIRPKGNTSLSQIVSDDTTDRFSFKIEFDHYVDDQTCYGLDKLVLNNLMSDATYMKEYISYDIMSYLGVPSSLYSYASISVNGETWGLYLALEGVEESFAERNFGSSYGNLYKPEGTMAMGGNVQRGFEVDNSKVPEESETDNSNVPGGFEADNSNVPGGFEMDSSNGGADLSYTDDEINSYSTIFDGAVFDINKNDKLRVIEALKNLSAGTNLENYIDVDEVLRYFASNVFLVNDDSYLGTMLHNYYLYEKNGKLSMIPWDYNLSFGGFQGNNATSLVNRAIDTVVSGTTLEARPMIGKLLEVAEYKDKYHEYLEELISGYFESGRFEETLDQVETLISTYVENDPTAFYTYDEYQSAVENLREFCMLRAESIRGQLDGTIPSTEEEQENDQDALIDASNVSITAMGTQGGGNKGGGMNGGGFGNLAENLPDRGDVQMPPNTINNSETNSENNIANNTESNSDSISGEGTMPSTENPNDELMSPPDNGAMNSEDASFPNIEDMQGMEGNLPDFGDKQGKRPGNMQGNFPGNNPQAGFGAGGNVQDSTLVYIISGVSIIVMSIIIVFVARYRRRKYYV